MIEQLELQKQTAREVYHNGKQNKSFYNLRDLFFLAPDTTFLRIFDPLILIVKIIQCVTSGYYIVFGVPYD